MPFPKMIEKLMQKFSPDTEKSMYAAEARVVELRQLLAGVRRHRAEVAAQIPEIERQIVSDLAEGRTPRGEITAANEELVEIDIRIARLEGALTIAAGKQAAAEAAHGAEARKQAVQAAEARVVAFEAKAKKLLAEAAEAQRAIDAAVTIGGSLSVDLGPFSPQQGMDGRVYPSAVETWIAGAEADRSRRSVAEQRKASDAQRHRRYGLQITARWKNYGAGDVITPASIEQAAIICANDCGVWLHPSDENAAAERVARARVAEITEANRSGRSLAGPYTPVPFISSSAGYIDGPEIISSSTKTS